MDLSDYRNKSGFDEGQADEVELLNFSDELDRLDIMMSKNDEYMHNMERDLPTIPDCDDLTLTIQEVSEEKAEMEEIVRSVQKRKAELNSDRDGIKTVKEELKLETGKADEWKTSMLEKNQRLQTMRDELESLRRQEREKDSGSKDKRTLLEQEIRKESELLGLEIRNTRDQSIILSYSNIDRSNSGRKYCCELKVVGRAYQLGEINPQIPDIQELLSTLNYTNDFSGFVVKLRERFLKVK